MMNWLMQKRWILFFSIVVCLLGGGTLPAEATTYRNVMPLESSTIQENILADIGIGDTGTSSNWLWQWTLAIAFGVIGLLILSVGILRWSFKGDTQETGGE